ncbi:MAG: hypothetical protein ABFD89_17460 [Bryobacteraceae bacterium]
MAITIPITDAMTASIVARRGPYTSTAVVLLAIAHYLATRTPAQTLRALEEIGAARRGGTKGGPGRNPKTAQKQAVSKNRTSGVRKGLQPR